MCKYFLTLLQTWSFYKPSGSHLCNTSGMIVAGILTPALNEELRFQLSFCPLTNHIALYECRASSGEEDIYTYTRVYVLYFPICCLWIQFEFLQQHDCLGVAVIGSLAAGVGQQVFSEISILCCIMSLLHSMSSAHLTVSYVFFTLLPLKLGAVDCM